MKTPLLIGAASAALALLLALMTVSWIPQGEIGVEGAPGEGRVLPAGFRIHSPFAGSPRLYPLQLGPVAGRAPLKSSEGVLYEVSFEVSGRLEEDRALEFDAAAVGHGTEKVLTQGASHGIAAAAESLSASDLATGALQEAAPEAAAALLGQVGVAEVALEVRMDSPSSLLRLAQSLAGEGKADLVGHLVQDAVAAQGGSWETHTALGLVKEAEGDLRGAESAYLDALSIRPDALAPMAQLTRIYRAVGEFDRLERLLVAALQAEPESLQHLNWLGSAYMKNGDLDSAVGTFERALEIRPGDTVILNNLGGVYLQQGRREEAIELFRQAVAAAPEDRQSLYNLGVGLCATDRCPEGLTHLLAADRSHPGRPRILEAIAAAYESLGNASKAREWRARAIVATSRVDDEAP